MFHLFIEFEMDLIYIVLACAVLVLLIMLLGRVIDIWRDHKAFIEIARSDAWERQFTPDRDYDEL